MMHSAWILVLPLLGSNALNLTLPDLASLTPGSIYFFPFPDAVCGSGNDAYYGVLIPDQVTEPKKVWIETMGGAICFSQESCSDDEFGVWMDLKRIIRRYVGPAVNQIFAYLTSGQPVPLSGANGFRNFGAGYIPNDNGQPLAGQYGFYLPACTGDAALGNYVVQYSGFSAHHSGAVTHKLLLEAIQRVMPDIDRITMLGGSGSAVSRVAWAPMTADMFPSAEVRVFADSAMHVLPATPAFNFFWEHVQWSPNPDALHTNATVFAPDCSTPDFDWRSPGAIADMLQAYSGRIKVLYIACNRDRTAYSDREALAAFANISVADIETEMWEFLQRLTADAPAGSVFSYISEGDCHHQSRRNGWVAANEGMRSPKQFSEDFLAGNVLSEPHIWCCGRVPSEPRTEVSSVPAQTASVALAAALATASLG